MALSTQIFVGGVAQGLLKITGNTVLPGNGTSIFWYNEFPPI
jgi:hypothetical protein